jgi:hypothetical protein
MHASDYGGDYAVILPGVWGLTNSADLCNNALLREHDFDGLATFADSALKQFPNALDPDIRFIHVPTDRNHALVYPCQLLDEPQETNCPLIDRRTVDRQAALFRISLGRQKLSGYAAHQLIQTKITLIGKRILLRFSISVALGSVAAVG